MSGTENTTDVQWWTEENESERPRLICEVASRIWKDQQPTREGMLRAARMALRTASALPMSGRGAPACTATATPECTKSTLLPASTLPAASSLSMASEARMTTSKASSASTRRAASTPPTASMAACAPPLCA